MVTAAIWLVAAFMWLSALGPYVAAKRKHDDGQPVGNGIGLAEALLIAVAAALLTLRMNGVA